MPPFPPRLVCAALLLAAQTAYPQRGSFAVGTVAAKAGESASGTLEIPAGADAGTQVPVTVVHGARPGPVLALVAGTHGYEYAPILALQKLRPLLDARRRSGTVILVQLANMPSFLGRTIYFSPIDGKNLNRVYPGKRDGTSSERIAYAITTHVIEKCDYLVDIHCGDGNESLRPYLYQAVTGDKKLDDAVAAMVLAWGLDHIVIDRGRPTDPAASVYCSSTALTRGKPAMTVEDGYLGTSAPESVQRIVAGAQNLARHLKMMEGAAHRVPNPVYLDPTEVLTSPATGVLTAHVERDSRVAKGALLASVSDFFGRRIGEVRSPFDGIVLYVVATPPITKGQPVAFVGVPSRQK